VCSAACLIWQLFKDWDANGDGVISREEFRTAMKALGVHGDKSDHDALFDKWDCA
jgi:Ca2+-binding EF-hand superfamily protein